MCIFMSEKNNLEKSKNEEKHEVGEDATKYGEFISSYFAWISLPQQKEKAEELQDMTKRKEKDRKNEKSKRKWEKLR